MKKLTNNLNIILNILFKMNFSKNLKRFQPCFETKSKSQKKKKGWKPSYPEI